MESINRLTLRNAEVEDSLKEVVDSFILNRVHSEIYFDLYVLNEQGTKIPEGERVIRAVLAVNDNDTFAGSENESLK